MKSSLLLITLLLISVAGFPNKIDSLWTVKDVAHFVSTLDKYFSDTTASFIKIDIDGNGLTDLIVKSDTLVIVVDKGNAGYQLHCLSPGDYISRYLLERIDSIHNEKLLILKRGSKRGYDDYQLYPKAKNIDTLVYKFNHFIEYNPAPALDSIKSIRLASTLCLGSCPEYNLIVYNDRKVAYNAGYHTGKSGHFSGIIEKPVFDELMQIINYIHVQSLDDDYAIGATDHPTAYLRVTFEDGKEKAIKDYGKCGTQGLRMLYQFMDKLRTSQKWTWDRVIR